MNDTLALLKSIESAGGRVVRSKSGHWKIYRDRQLITTVPYSPSDWRSLANARRTIRNAGIPL